MLSNSLLTMNVWNLNLGVTLNYIFICSKFVLIKYILNKLWDIELEVHEFKRRANVTYITLRLLTKTRFGSKRFEHF